MPHYNPDVLVQSSTNNDNLVAAEDRSDEYAQRKRKRWENDIRDELIAQQFDGDVEALVPTILEELYVRIDRQRGNDRNKASRRRLTPAKLTAIVEEFVDRQRSGFGRAPDSDAKDTSAAASTADAGSGHRTTCAAFAVANDDDAGSEYDPHSGLTSPRGVDADVTTISSINSNSNVEEDSKMPAVQEVTSSMSVSNVPDDDNNENEDDNDNDSDNEMLDKAGDADDIIALPPPPAFDEDHLRVIGEGIHQIKVAQVDVGNVGKTNSSGSLLYLPPKSWSPDHDMHPLRDAKIVLRTRFKGIPNEAVGGMERIPSLGKVHRSSDLYHTLILSTKNDEGTSVVLWKSVEEGRSWFISWLAVNVKCERKGYPTYLLRCIHDLAKGFGINDIYLEVGKSSTIRDGGEWDGVKVFYTKLGFIDAGDDVPDEGKACCQELAKGTHEVLKWDLNKRMLRASRRIRR